MSQLITDPSKFNTPRIGVVIAFIDVRGQYNYIDSNRNINRLLNVNDNIFRIDSFVQIENATGNNLRVIAQGTNFTTIEISAPMVATQSVGGRGARGPIGPIGATGVTGATGATGSTGANGSGVGFDIWTVFGGFSHNAFIDYISFFNIPVSLNESDVQYKYNGIGPTTLSRFHIKVVSPNPSSVPITLTVRVDGADTPISIIIPPNGVGYFQDNVHNTIVSPGSLVSIRIVGDGIVNFKYMNIYSSPNI